MINDPNAGQHDGVKGVGHVYANVTERALRVLRVAPKIENNNRAVVTNHDLDLNQSGGGI